MAGQGPRMYPSELGVEDCLDLEMQVDLVGDNHAAALDRRVPGDAEVRPVDLARRGKAGPGAAVCVRAEAVDLELERHAAGYALEGQFTLEHVVAAVRAEPGGPV